jgi:hypothetical protein
MAAYPVALDQRFVDALQANRVALNERVAQALARFPRLTPTDIERTLTQFVQPVMLAMPGFGGSTEIGLAHFDEIVSAGLHATGTRLLGAAPAVDRLWTEVLPDIGALLVADPQLAGELTFASAQMIRLSSQRMTQPDDPSERWIALLSEAAPLAHTPDSMRAIGVLIAWRCGLAQYRDAALRVADEQPDAVRQVLIAASPTDTAKALGKCRANRWITPQEALTPSLPEFRTVAQFGSYRGLGGQFVVPPLVGTTTSEGKTELIVASGTDRWAVDVDAFGATLHRVNLPQLAPDPLAPEETVRVAEYLKVLQSRGDLDALGQVTSAVVWDGALAFTSAGSYRIRCVVP